MLTRSRFSSLRFLFAFQIARVERDYTDMENKERTVAKAIKTVRVRPSLSLSPSPLENESDLAILVLFSRSGQVGTRAPEAGHQLQQEVLGCHGL